MSFDWKGLLGNVAPVIGTALGGPFGALAGAAVKLALGLPEDSDDKTIARAMERATPEQLLALQNAERQFKLDMEKLNVDVMRLDVEDKKSAREREVGLTGFGKYATPVLAATVVAGFFGTVSYALGWGLKNLDASAAAFAGTLIGYVSAKADQVVSYYFGSSNSSRSKDQLLYNSSPVK